MTMLGVVLVHGERKRTIFVEEPEREEELATEEPLLDDESAAADGIPVDGLYG